MCALTDSVVHLIVKEILPFNTVKKPAFRNREHACHKQFTQLYNSMKENMLKDIKGLYAADLWSGSIMSPYMSLNIHCITAAWTLNSKSL